MLKQLDATPPGATALPRRFRRSSASRTLTLGPAALAATTGGLANGGATLRAPVAVRTPVMDPPAAAPAPVAAGPTVSPAAPPTQTTPAVRPLIADASALPQGPPVAPDDDRPAAVAPEPPTPRLHRPPPPPPLPDVSLPQRTRPPARQRRLGPAARAVLGLVAATAVMVIIVASLIGPGHPSAHTPRSALSPASTTLPAPAAAIPHHRTARRRRVVHRPAAHRRTRHRARRHRRA